MNSGIAFKSLEAAESRAMLLSADRIGNYFAVLSSDQGFLVIRGSPQAVPRRQASPDRGEARAQDGTRMKLDEINWDVITRPWAARMIGAASLNEKRKAALWEAGEIEEAEWWNAYLILENLQVFTVTGERPSCP